MKMARMGRASLRRLIVLGVGLHASVLPAWADEVSYPQSAPLVWPAMVTRESEHADKHGRFHPPWKTVTVGTVIPRAVSVGDAVTVLLLKRGVPAQELKVTKVKPQPAAADLMPATWVVDIDASTESFLAAKPDRGRGDDTPFDAIVIHPATPKARVHETRMRSRDLPREEGCSLRTLWAAVDLESDGRPDVAIFKFCCDKPAIPTRQSGPSPCQNDCRRIYLREAGQSWRLVHEDSDF